MQDTKTKIYIKIHHYMTKKFCRQIIAPYPH